MADGLFLELILHFISLNYLSLLLVFLSLNFNWIYNNENRR